MIAEYGLSIANVDDQVVKSIRFVEVEIFAEMPLAA